jgi:MFS family permease
LSNSGGTTIRHDPYAAFRFRDFRLLWSASILSVFGAFLESTALGWELYERTGDPLVLANVGLAEFIPVLLLALPAGHLADRINRKTIAVVSRLLEMCGALGLAYCSWTQAPIPLTYAFILLTSAARTFQGPAAESFFPQVVPTSVFANAVTWRTTSFQISGVTSPALAGLMIAAFAGVQIPGPINVGATLAYLLSATGSLVIVVLIALLNIKPTPSEGRSATLADVFAGLRFVFREKLILSAITLDLFAVLFGGAVALLPVFAKDVLNAGPQGFGLLRAAPAIGAVLTALVLTRLPPIRQAGRTLLWVVAGFGVATIVFGLSTSYVLSLIALAFTGAFDNVSMVIRGALVPLRTPDAMRGRVSAVERVFISSSNELGAWESGFAAWLVGPFWAVVGGGIGTLLVVGIVVLAFPQLRNLGSIDQIEAAT